MSTTTTRTRTTNGEHAQPVTTPPTESQATAPPLTLGDLAVMSADELGECYRAGSVPDSMHALDGSAPGRMLAVNGTSPRGFIGAMLRQLAESDRFPWEGKTFTAQDDQRGGGVNRVKLLGERYTFHTRFEPSAVDGEPCIVLDYDHDGNPGFIRAIRDELREVSPNLYLGPALLYVRKVPRLLLYFAVDKQGY